MKNNTKANRIDELHSNMALMTSMISLLALTFVTFVYNAYTQINPQNMLLVVSVISWGFGVFLMIPVNRKSAFWFEYSACFLVLAIGIYALHGIGVVINGIALLTIKQAFYGTVAFLVAYWIYTIVIHCFVLPVKLYSKTFANIVIIVLALLLPALMTYVYLTNHTIPGYSIWM